MKSTIIHTGEFLQYLKKLKTNRRNISQDNNDEYQKQHLIVLPYNGHKGAQVVNSVRKLVTIKVRTCYTSKRLINHHKC